MTDADLITMKRIAEIVRSVPYDSRITQTRDRRKLCELIAIGREVLSLMDTLQEVQPPPHLRQEWESAVETATQWLEDTTE